MLLSVAWRRLGSELALVWQLSTVHVRPVLADWDKRLCEPTANLRFIAVDDLRLWHWWGT